MKILTILGARPQFIKAGSVSREIANPNYFLGIGANKEKILNVYRNNSTLKNSELDLYGDGKASENIIKEILNFE